RVLRLQGGDRMDTLRAPDRVGSCLGKPEVADLALGDELRHGADRVLDGRVRINAMLIVEIDVVDAEAPQGALARAPHVVRTPIHTEVCAIGRAHVAELRRDDDVVAAPLDRATNELLVREWAVHVGRIEKGDSELDGARDRPQGFPVVTARVEVRHAHATEAKGRAGKTFGAERASLHNE